MWNLVSSVAKLSSTPGLIWTVTEVVYSATRNKFENENNTNENINDAVHQNNMEIYKQKQIRRFKDKYNVEIKFYGGKIEDKEDEVSICIASPWFSKKVTTSYQKDSKLSLSEKIFIVNTNENDSITLLEQETDEIIQLINILKKEKDESIN